MTEPDFDDEEGVREQEGANILLLRVALRLLGEARVRGDFGDEEDLGERAVAIADEITGGTPSPDPRRPIVEATLIRPDRISLLAPFDESSAVASSLMLDGTLYDEMVRGAFGRVTTKLPDPEAMTEEERAEYERRHAEWQARTARLRQFTASRFVRAVTPRSRPESSRPILAVLLYEDGFYVESTYEEVARRFDPEMDVRQFFAKHRAEGPAITVTDDVGTEYFRSGGGNSGGVQVRHASQGFAPAPPASADVLHVATDDASFDLPLRG